MSDTDKRRLERAAMRAIATRVRHIAATEVRGPGVAGQPQMLSLLSGERKHGKIAVP